MKIFYSIVVLFLAVYFMGMLFNAGFVALTFLILLLLPIIIFKITKK